MDDLLNLRLHTPAQPFPLRRDDRPLLTFAQGSRQPLSGRVAQEELALAGADFLMTGQAKQELDNPVIEIRLTQFTAESHREMIVHAQHTREFGVTEVTVKRVGQSIRKGLIELWRRIG